MRKLSKNVSKTANILTAVSELVCEIVLFPFHIVKAICDIVKELNS